MWQELAEGVKNGDTRKLARCISMVENDAAGYGELLQSLPAFDTPVIGVTGPPGAGKSTLVDALIQFLIEAGNKVAVLCVDPSSPFTSGALLGDRVRMRGWYNEPRVYIRSLASRGALGGLAPKIIEITDVLKGAGFDYVLIETVGVGQSEVEIARLADITAVVVVPEGGDEIQTMKAGMMEIADIFVVNKADRPGADQFVHNLELMLAPAFSRKPERIPILKTIATRNEGTRPLYDQLIFLLQNAAISEKRSSLLAEKAYSLLQQKRMKGISKSQLMEMIREKGANFHLYRFVEAL